MHTYIHTYIHTGSGLKIGKEGPFIHVACAVANVLSRFFSKYHTNEVNSYVYIYIYIYTYMYVYIYMDV